VGDEHVLADLEAAVLLQVAGHEVRRAGRDRRAQHQQLPLGQQRQQVVEHGADVAHVDLDVGEARRAEREHDRLRLRRVRRARRERQLGAGQQLVGARLLERHPALAHAAQAVGVAVDAQHGQAGRGEAERERQPDPPEADDAHVIGHRRQG